jgi:2-keto-4-pentenoate hydratase/2-oxohepta-3-ene-1,7-dioic acid hydratase in catechol pathway
MTRRSAGCSAPSGKRPASCNAARIGELSELSAHAMPGIGNKYFPLTARAPNVASMTSAPAGYALGVFRRPAAGPGDVFTGLVRGDRVRDVSALGTVSDLLADWETALGRLGELAETGDDTSDWTALDGLDVRCPVAPAQILQCGANYRSHVVDIVMAERLADESMTGHNSDVPAGEVRAWAEAMMDERAATGSPYVFAGLPSALTGPCDEIVLPGRGTHHDWELELAAVMGRPARNLTRANALDHVAGYTICNDITTRSLVYRRDLKAIGTDWFAAKNAPTFLPTGPFLVPADFAGDPAGLRITLTHNGIKRQDESCADMLFDLPAILEYITSVTALRPGDLVLTGSPAGNGAHWGVFLAAGDVLEGEITGLGRQRNRCVRERDKDQEQSEERT